MTKKDKAKQTKIQNLYAGELKQAGPNLLRGRCPFHDDGKMPSFTIYTATNTFFCFSHDCRASGDVISYVMRLHNVDFKEALTILL
jgi:DNA primase